MSSYSYRLEEGLISLLEKAHKKDKKLYEAAFKKMGRRRVHIEKSFVLTFRINDVEKKVTFIDLCHHDKVYKKK